MKQFLPKILATKPQTDEVKVWVVDNASEDNTWEFLSDHFPQVNKIRLEVNKGFTNGYVASLSQIEADYYVLISSDIEVEGDWVSRPIEMMKEDPRIAAVQPKVMSFDRRDHFEYAGGAGGYIDHLGYPFCRGRLINHLEVDEGQYDNETEVFWGSGACLFIRADLYHKAGGFDNDFYAHMEEIDLCWRLKTMGYKIGFCPTSKVYHMGGFIISYGSPGKVFRNHRNNLIMLLKNMKGTELLWKLPLRFVMDWATFAKMVLDGEGKAATGVLKAHWQFLLYFPKWFAKRVQVRRLRNNPNLFGIYPKSIVWQVLVKGVKKYSSLHWKA